MRKKDYLGSVKQSKAELHLCKEEKDLIEELRRGAAEEENNCTLPVVRGVAGEEILYDFPELGYSAEAVQFMFLVPAF